MRTVLLLLFLFSFSSSLLAQFSLSGGVNMHTPLHEQKHRLKNAYGLGAAGEYHFQKVPFFAVMEGSWSVNGIKDIHQDLSGPTGYITDQTINYTSSLFLLSAGLGIEPLKETNVSPYLTMKGGYIKYRTVMSLPDPYDPDGCRAVETENIVRDLTAVGVLGVGARIKLSQNLAERYFIDFGANYITGGKARYLKMKSDHDHVDPSADAYYVKFQNVQTGDVHEHPLGEVHHTKTRQLQIYIRFNVMFRN